MRTDIRITLPLVILFFCFISSFVFASHVYQWKEDPQKVTRIIDGDTFEIASGDIVRLVCINTPERGKSGYQEAKEYLSALILDKHVDLEIDSKNTDAYGRLLRYVYINNISVNKNLLDQKYATYFPYNNTLYCDKLLG